MANNKKRRSRFRHGLHIYLSLLCFVAALLLIVLWVYLSRYQSDLDRQKEEQARLEAAAAYELSLKRAPQLTFENFLNQSDSAYWTEQWFAAHPESFDEEEKVRQYFEELFAGEDFHAWKDESYSDEKPVYVLKSGANSIARVTLGGAGLDWSVSRVELLLEGREAAEYRAPEGFAVFCNGRQLADGTDEGPELFDMAPYAAALEHPVSWRSYHVEGQLFQPVLTAEAPAGSEVLEREDGAVFYTLGAAESEVFRQRAEAFIYDLLRYYMMGNVNTGGNMITARNHVEPGSPAYTMISETLAGVIWDTCYGNTSYQVEAGPACRLADNCLLVEVTYHAEGSVSGHTNVADGVYRVYFLDHGNGYQIYVLAYG